MKFNLKFWLTMNFMETESCFKKHYRILEIGYETIGLNHFRSTWRRLNYLDSGYSYIGVLIALCVPIFSLTYATTAFDDLDELLTCLISFFTSVQVIVKTATIIFAYNAINDLRNIVIENTSDVNISDRECHEIAVKYNTIAGRVAKLTLVAYFCAWGCFNAYPIFTSKQWTLPVTFEIPGISHRNHPGYEITYVFVFYETVYAVMVLVGFDGTVILFSIYISSRLELCKYYFLQIGDFNTKYNTVEKQTQLVIKCAKLQAETYIFTQKCSKLFGPAILSQILSTVGLLCMTMVHLRINIYCSSSMMFQATLVQVFMYCCCGELIVSQATAVTRSIYENQWYNIKSPSERKMILFMLHCSQMPIGFSAAGFYKLSMETFTVICKTAYSFFAFLMKIM